MRSTGGFWDAENQQNPLTPGERELPIPITVRPASPHREEKLGFCSNSDEAFAREPIIMPRTSSLDPCGGVWQRKCYEIWLSRFACVSDRKSETRESFSKPEFVVVDLWTIWMDERLGRPFWGAFCLSACEPAIRKQVILSMAWLGRNGTGSFAQLKWRSGHSSYIGSWQPSTHSRHCPGIAYTELATSRLGPTFYGQRFLRADRAS